MRLTGATQLFAILGDPVQHSLSPVLQNAWIEAAGIDAVYVPLAIAGEGAERGFAGLHALGLKGANVTLPHKERAARVADQRDAASERLAAANVLTWEQDGTISAFNTDCSGLVCAFDEAFPDWRSETRTALVVGAGGAGRAAAWGLRQAGIPRIVVCNRTPAAGEAAATLVEGAFIPWDKLGDGFAEADVIINATSLGMRGKDGHTWPVSRARSTTIVMDTVYAPRETDLLTHARGLGLRTVDGLGMLLHQGALAFALWFDQQPDIALGRASLESALGGALAESGA